MEMQTAKKQLANSRIGNYKARHDRERLLLDNSVHANTMLAM